MARVLSITAATTSLRTNAKGQAEVSFTVTNTSGRPRTARAEVKASEPAQQPWLSVEGEPERDFPVGGTHQVSAKVAVPPGTPPGSHSFRLDVVSTANPDDDFAEGPTVSLEVGALAPEKKKFPWWIVAAAAAVLVIAGVTAYFLMSETEPEVQAVSMPNIVGEQLEQAKLSLVENNLKVGEITSRLTEGGKTGEVASQDPPAGKEVAPGTEVRIETVEAGAKVPADIVGKPIEDAKKMITSAGLKVGGTVLQPATSAADNKKALEVKPAAGTLVPLETAVDIRVGMLVIIGAQAPNVLGLSRSDAEAKIKGAGLKLGKVDIKLSAPGTGSKVVAQSPSPQDGTVAADSNVNLTVAEAAALVPNVKGSTRDKAFIAIRDANLRTKEVTRPVPSGMGLIVDQTPKSGTLVPPDTEILIVVGTPSFEIPKTKMPKIKLPSF